METSPLPIGQGQPSQLMNQAANRGVFLAARNDLVGASLHGVKVMTKYNLRSLKLTLARTVESQRSQTVVSSMLDQFDTIDSFLQNLR